MEAQEILGYKLVMTCGACPEQYDVFDSEGKQVGYLRLRHGCFRAYYPDPDCDGATVYHHAFDDDWKGLFDSDEEREFFLTESVEAIHNQVQLEKE